MAIVNGGQVLVEEFVANKTESGSDLSTSQFNRRKVLQGAALVAAGSAITTSPVLAQAGRVEAPKGPVGPVTINVSNAAMKATKEGVVVTDANLAALVRSDRAGIVELMKATVPGLQPSEVSVNSAGRVLINNARFTGQVGAAKIGDINLCHINWRCGKDADKPVKK